MANTKKRVLSLLMALVMTLGLLPISALAANNAGQISDHYAPTVNEKGEVTEWTNRDTADTVTDETNGVTVQKKIDGTDQENEFDITLNVTTKEQLENLTVSPDAAVVVVLDVSNSMEDKLDGEVKLTQAKAAAKEFVTSLAKGAEGARRMVSVVQFDTDAIAVQPWTNAVGAADSINSTIDSEVTPRFMYHECQISGEHTHEESYIKAAVVEDWVYNGVGAGHTCTVCGRNPYLVVHDHCTFTGCTQKTDTKHKHTVSYPGPHGKMKESGGDTNIEAGLQLASNLLTQLSGLDGCAKIDKRYVVLLSDGAPHRSISSSADKTSTTFIKGAKSDEDDKAKTRAATVATQIRATDGNAATLYAISYAKHKNDELNSNAKWLKRDIASPNGFFDAASNETLDLAFEKINEQIKLLAQAWTVDDPMGEDVSFVRFNDGVGGDNEIRKEDGGTIHWDLKRDTPKHIGDTYTYSLSYRVKLNTVKEGFDEAIDHRTNGLTTLKYVVTKDGVVPENPKVLQLHFNVPSVKGTVPTLHYSIEYYLQETAQKEDYDNYTKCAELKGLSAKMHTPVSVTDKDPDYQDNYNAQNYHWVKSNPESIKLTQDNTVLKVYYDHDTVEIPVNYFLATKTTDKDGNVTNGDYTDTVKVENYSNRVTVNKGEKYTADDLNTKVGYENCIYLKGDREVMVNTGTEEINLYYTLDVDERDTTTVDVKYQVNNYTWALEMQENGEEIYKKTLVPGAVQDYQKVQDVRTPSQFTQSVDALRTDKTLPDDEYRLTAATLVQGGITSQLGTNSDTLSFTTKKDGNTLTLVFEKISEAPAETPATLTVTHNYVKDVTTIINGKTEHDQAAHASFTTNPAGSATWYVGETHLINADQTRPGGGADTYLVTGDSSKLVKLTTAANTDSFSYKLTAVPEATTATVNFIYRTYEKVTVVNEGGTESEMTQLLGIPVTHSIQVPLTGETLYENQYVKIPTDTGRLDGYTFNEEDSTQNYTAIPAKKNSETVINLYYDNDETVDHRNADVTVTHTYTATKTTVNAQGVVVRELVQEGKEPDSVYTGRAGEKMFNEDENIVQLVHNENTYDRTDTTPLDGNFVAGTNQIINLTYHRDDTSALEGATYQANYEYYDWTMTVDANGVAGYHAGEGYVKNATLSNSTAVINTTAAGEPLYAGMHVQLIGSTDDNYQVVGAPEMERILTKGDNVYTLTFVKQIPLASATVTVNHHYERTTKNETGAESIETSDVPGIATPITLYVGAQVSVSARMDGYPTLESIAVTGADGKAVAFTPDESNNIVFTATGTDSVVFSYSDYVDNSVAATYLIQHFYRTVDWDGTTVVEEYKADDTKTQSGTTYATVHQSATQDLIMVDGKPTYRFTDITWTGCDTPVYNGKTYTMQLKPGENTLNFYYTKTVDTRPEASVIVNHIYRVTDSNAPGGFVQEAVVSEQKFVKAPGQYTAEQEPNRTEGEKTINYTFLSSDHTDCKLDVIFEGNNVINLYYTRNYGEGEGFAVSGTKTYVGLNPDQYPVTTVSLSQNGEQKYSETVINGHFGFANVVPGVYDISESAAVSGYTYTAQYELTANTANALQSRALVQGKVDITGNPQITVVAATEYLLEITNTYTQTITPPPTEPIIPPVEPDNDPEEGYGPGENPLENLETPEVPLADLPETEIPLAELPETEIPETEVPLAEAPATGDNLAMWIMAAAISGLSLVWLMISGKKREDENAE